MRKPRTRRHDKQLVETLSEASGISASGIKQLSIILCKKVDIDWPLKWRTPETEMK